MNDAPDLAAENARLRAALASINQRTLESGTGEMGLITTIAAVSGLVREALSPPATHVWVGVLVEREHVSDIRRLVAEADRNIDRLSSMRPDTVVTQTMIDERLAVWRSIAAQLRGIDA